jgi:NAD/NADP octopine/nopaline dehydrogenase, alpha-helical domain.
MGFEVRLYNRTDSKLVGVRWHGGVELEGAVEGFGPVSLGISDMAEALRGVDVVMVDTPATAHRDIAIRMAPCLEDGQIVLLNPGRTGVASEFRAVLLEKGLRTYPLIAEAQTFIYAARALSRNRGHIYRIKNGVPLAALPSYWTPELLGVLDNAFLQFIAGSNVLAREWLYPSYDSPEADLWEAIRNTESYRSIMAPSSIAHRCIFEDVPMSLVPIATLGSTLSAPTPTIDIIIELGSILHGNGGKG